MLLARFRPTPRQALGRGLYLGGWLAVLAVVIAAVLHLAGVLPPAVDSPLAVLALAVLAPVLCGAAGLVVCRRYGTEVDAGGYAGWPARPRRYSPGPGGWTCGRSGTGAASRWRRTTTGAAGSGCAPRTAVPGSPRRARGAARR